MLKFSFRKDSTWKFYLLKFGESVPSLRKSFYFWAFNLLSLALWFFLFPIEPPYSIDTKNKRNSSYTKFLFVFENNVICIITLCLDI